MAAEHAFPRKPDDVPLHEMLRAHARRNPGKTAYQWYGTALSYAELDRMSDAFAARLAQQGVRKGDPVALFMQNCPQYLIAHYGIQKLGAVVCPCGALNREHELEYQLGDVGARVIVAAAPLLPIVAQVRSNTRIEHVFVVHYEDMLPEMPEIDLPAELRAMREAEPIDVGDAEDFLACARSGATPPPVEIDLDDIALIVYTSGSTGLPKGAMLSYDNALYKAAASCEAYKVDADQVMLAVAPLYHIAGMLMAVAMNVYAGATTVLMYRFDPVAVLQAIERCRTSWWWSLTPMNLALMEVPDIGNYDLSSLRYNPATSFGAPFTEEIATRWQSFAKNCLACEAAYGLTETHTMDTAMPFDAIRWGTAGRAVAGNEVRIVDPKTGAQQPPDTPGEITIHGRGVFHGYLNKPEATATTLRDGWVYTGDMGRMDADGYLTWMGRFKEMIKVSGYSVFPEEVETILVRRAGISQAAVIGVADATKGEVVKAFVVLEPGASAQADEIIAWARENMAPYKVPRQIEFRDALPTSGAGKVLRRLLRDD